MFAGMVFGVESWSIDPPAHTQTTEDTDKVDPEDVHIDTLIGESIPSELDQWNFWKYPELATITPERIPARTLPSQHDVHVLPLLHTFWISIKFMLHTTPYTSKSVQTLEPLGFSSSQPKTPTPTFFSPIVIAGLRLLMIFSSVAPTFLGNRFQQDIWPLYSYILGKCVYEYLQLKHISVSTMLYKVFSYALECIIQCIISADIGALISKDLLAILSPILLHTIDTKITQLVYVIFSICNVHNTYATTYLLTNLLSKLGVTRSLIVDYVSTQCPSMALYSHYQSPLDVLKTSTNATTYNYTEEEQRLTFWSWTEKDFFATHLSEQKVDGVSCHNVAVINASEQNVLYGNIYTYVHIHPELDQLTKDRLTLNQTVQPTHTSTPSSANNRTSTYIDEQNDGMVESESTVPMPSVQAKLAKQVK